MDTIRATIAKEIHRQRRRNFPTRHVELKGINDLYQADLVEMIPYEKLNNGYRYIMTVIDCFSKYAFAVPLKNKSSTDIVTALKPIVEKYPIRNFQTDQGKEWFNISVQMLFKRNHINHYYTYSDKKASIVERFNRTLKTMMWRMFTEKGSYKWIDDLQNLIKTYNSSFHRTIGTRPIDVNKNNEQSIRQKIYSDRKKNYYKMRTHPKFKVNSHVRISRYKSVFDKGYHPNFSNEIFRVHQIKQTKPVTYILKDYKGEVIKGTFYEEELTNVKYPNVYLVEKVIRTKGNKVFVKWLGFDNTHNSWIDKKDIV